MTAGCSLRIALAVTSQFGERVARLREEWNRRREAAATQETRELQSRLDAERAAVRGQLAVVEQSSWWDGRTFATSLTRERPPSRGATTTTSPHVPPKPSAAKCRTDTASLAERLEVSPSLVAAQWAFHTGGWGGQIGKMRTTVDFAGSLS